MQKLELPPYGWVIAELNDIPNHGIDNS